MVFKALFFGLVLITFCFENLASGAIKFKQGSPHVTLSNGGTIAGSVQFSRDGRPFTSFVGIAYATVPKRFQESQPILESSWQGIFNATIPGVKCTQKLFGGNGEAVGEENCLNLNVYSPLNPSGPGKSGYPVMVWVHGGGFMFGSGRDCGPKFFMDEDIILVTLNYRLGVFGFLSLGDDTVPGNNGLKDIVLALKWVQLNIKKFGGDKKKVTLFGESAGGSAVHHLLLSPTTKGLFHRAISQSGSALNSWAFDPNPRKTALHLAEHLKCPSLNDEISSKEILACLQRLSTEDLNNAQYSFRTDWVSKLRPFLFRPVAESTSIVSELTPFQVEPPLSILTNLSKPLPEIPWIIGATKHEGDGMATGFSALYPEKAALINEEWDSIAPILFEYGRILNDEISRHVSDKLRNFYFNGKRIFLNEEENKLADIFSDELTLYAVYKAALETAARGRKHSVLFYQYSYPGPVSIMSGGAPVHNGIVGHADDLQHLFDLQEMFAGGGDLIKSGTQDEYFSRNFVRLWASFAKYGHNENIFNLNRVNHFTCLLIKNLKYFSEVKHTWGNGTWKKWKPISRQELQEGQLNWYLIQENPVSVQIDKEIMNRMKFWDALWNEYFVPAMANEHGQSESLGSQYQSRGKIEL